MRISHVYREDHGLVHISHFDVLIILSRCCFRKGVTFVCNCSFLSFIDPIGFVFDVQSNTVMAQGGSYENMKEKVGVLGDWYSAGFLQALPKDSLSILLWLCTCVTESL